MDAHHWQNLVVTVLVLCGVGAWLQMRRSDLWSNAGREVVRRRPLACAFVGIYVLLALGDARSRGS